MPYQQSWGSNNESGWLSARTAISFGAGALLMLTASRIAPPFAGRAIGSLRSMAGTDPFEALAQGSPQGARAIGADRSDG